MSDEAYPKPEIGSRWRPIDGREVILEVIEIGQGRVELCDVLDAKSVWTRSLKHLYEEMAPIKIATPKTTSNGRQQIIDKMIAAVMSDRNKTYGDPENNFGNIAAYWNIHLEARKQGPLTPLDVAIMMKLMKVARLSTNPTHVDSWVDSAGYAACGGGIVVSKEEKK